MTGQEFLDAIAAAGGGFFDLSEFDQCPQCGMIRGGHTLDCDADELEALRAFGEVIASCIRARLVARAMEGREVRIAAGDADFAAWRFGGEWQVIRWIRGNGECVEFIHGTPEDTAAEVVDTLLRLAAEWSER